MVLMWKRRYELMITTELATIIFIVGPLLDQFGREEYLNPERQFIGPILDDRLKEKFLKP